jgi:hypothetical protein
MKTQSFPVGSELKAEVVQRNLEDLFQDSHTHSVRTTAPSVNEGLVGDIIPVLLNNTPYVYIKYPSIGWKRILAS